MNYYLERMFNSNGFDILVKENRLRTEYLSAEDKNILKKLVSRLSASKLSAFDVQISQKDFIGMALEAERRGETLSNVIGNDMNSFCDGIIKNGRKKGWKEAVMLAMPVLISYLAVYYGFIYVLYDSCPAIMKINLRDSFIYLFWCLIGMPLLDYSRDKTVFEGKFKKTLLILLILGFYVFSIALDSVFHLDQIVLFEVIGWVPLAVMLILLMVFFSLRNIYLSRLAKYYSWSDR